jgi:hypothetical protein
MKLCQTLRPRRIASQSSQSDSAAGQILISPLKKWSAKLLIFRGRRDFLPFLSERGSVNCLLMKTGRKHEIPHSDNPVHGRTWCGVGCGKGTIARRSAVPSSPLQDCRPFRIWAVSVCARLAISNYETEDYELTDHRDQSCEQPPTAAVSIVKPANQASERRDDHCDYKERRQQPDMLGIGKSTEILTHRSHSSKAQI